MSSAEHNQPNGLLAALLPHGVLVQPEVALTRSICWLLGLEGAAGALDDLVRKGGFEPEAGGFWRTEVTDGDGWRSDLEYWWGDPAGAKVVIEAKIGHTLTVEQLAGYRSHLADMDGLLVILLPEARRLEAERIKQKAMDDYWEIGPSGPIRIDIWTYDEVLNALHAHLPASSDVAQFKGLVGSVQALDIYPVSPEQLLDGTRSEDIWRVVETASFGLFGTILPTGTGWSGFARSRYVATPPYDVGMAVGVGRNGQPDGQSWAWIRVPKRGSYSWVAHSVLEELRPGETSLDETALWTPLRIPTGIPGSMMIQAVREEIESVASAIAGAIERKLIAEMNTVAPILQKSVARVLGMPPVSQIDAEDTSMARRADIELIIQEAARAFFDGKIWPRITTGDDYELARYIPVYPYEKLYIATAIGRKNRPADRLSQPWAWIRVNNEDSHAELAFEVLERVAPGQVVQDARSRSIPLIFPAGAEGPEMLEAIHGQISAVIAGIRAAVMEEGDARAADLTNS